MNLDDMLATIADLKEKATPPQYVLCGTERCKALMQESGLDPDTPEGEHTLNEARKKAAYTGQGSNDRSARSSNAARSARFSSSAIHRVGKRGEMFPTT